jgi:hypothetical protein
VGLLLTGSGEGEDEESCSPSDLCDPGTDSEDYDDTSQFMIEADLLFHAGSKLRLGFGVMFVPTSEVEFDGSSSGYELGTEIVPIGILEGIFGGAVAGTVRVFVGPDILIAGGDLEDDLKDADEACRDAKNAASAAGASLSCDVGGSPFFGYTLGIGGGIVGRVDESIGLRGDLTLQYVSLGGPTFESSSTGQSFENKLSTSGTRFWLTGGLEF